MSSTLAPCPVCLVRVSPELLLQHMGAHSKEEVVAALLQRSGGRSNQDDHARLGPAPALFSGAPAPTSSSGPLSLDSTGIHFLAANSMDFSSSYANSLTMATAPMAGRMHLNKSLMAPPFTLLPSGSSGSAASAATSSAAAQMMNPIFMPQMMGMMQVMSSPCLIPQANGPPLLVNMPSYVYPNMMMNAGMGGLQLGGSGHQNLMPAALNLSQQPQSVLLPTQPLPVSTEASILRSAHEMQWTSAAGTAAPHVFRKSTPSPRKAAAIPMNISEDSSSCSHDVSDLIVVEEEEAEAVKTEEQLEAKSEASFNETKPVKSSAKEVLAEVDTNSQSDDERSFGVISPVPGPSTKPFSVHRMLQHQQQQQHRPSGPLKLKIKNLKDETSSSSSRVTTVHDTLLSETSSSRDLLSRERTSSPIATTTLSKCPSSSSSSKSDGGVFGFTQYAEDSPYPAASLNFSSMLLDGPPPPPASTAPVSKLLSQKPMSPINEDSNSNNSNVCTVQTVTDLKNALKSDEDIQIVVPNELLETSEFKSFISTLNSFPLHDAASPSHCGGTVSEYRRTDNPMCAVPPNTPNPTRPSSASAELSVSTYSSESPLVNMGMLSPQPGSSREVSRGGFEDSCSQPASILPNGLHSDSDDDITLQDLVAMETLEDADVCEDDQFFTLSSSTNPLEPFMNAILQVPTDASSVFSCEKCGLHFGTLLEFRNHKDVCTSSRSHKGSGGRKSSKKCKVKNASFSRPPPDHPAIEDNNLDWPDADLIKTEVKNEIKSELSMDSTCQPVLAATGQNWKCNQCKVVFETGPQLLEHLDLMRSSDYKCSSCHIIFDDRKMLMIHRRKLHPSLPKIKIEPSGTITRDVAPNENGEFVCDKCDRAFREKDLLLKHMTCHDEEKPFECLECGKKFTKSSLLRDHRRRHFEVGAFECGFCQKRFYTPNKLREHVRVHTGEAPLSCNVCGKTFRRHSNLSEHKRTHLDNRPVKPPKELFCHCGKVFKTQRDLDWHKEGEHDKQPKKCTYCGEVFVHGSSLTRHIRLKHEVNFLPENKKTSLYASCPVCQQMFYKTSINKHIRIKHQGQKPYSCDVCKAAFVTKCNLLNHQWQHKGVRARPFKCQLCKKAYLRQSLLDAHMRSHRGVKPFVCNECGLQFANKSNWQRHVAEHQGARNYECPHCQKRFSRGYYLTDHLKVHTGEKPYVCGICGKMAATRSNYNSHLRTHITREPVNSEV